MTQINEVDNLMSQKNLITDSSLSLNSLDPSNPKDELLKSDMMKKLSLKEKWLNEQAAAAALPKVVPMEVDEKPTDKKKPEKKSFFNGILSNVKHLIKHDKDKSSKSKSKSPPCEVKKSKEDEKIDDDFFDELVVESVNLDELLVESDQPVPGCVSKRIKAFLQKQKSDEIREGADEILNEIKDGNDRMAKQMRDMEQKRFSDNMNAIKSSVVDSKVASMKEVNLSKYFPSQLEKKPPAVAKNRDVKALKDVNLSKYFPQASPTPGKKISGSPTGQSATSSAAASPLMPRKNVNEIDLANYFPGTPTLSRKNSVSTPPSSPLTENSPSGVSFERRFSITNSIPPPPPPPRAKINILNMQTVKKRPLANENVDTNAQVKKEASPVKKETSPVKPQKTKQIMKDDFNMFDQLLDGAIDLKQIEENFEMNVDNFDKLERSPSKEYAKIFDSGSGKGKSGLKEISPAKVSADKTKRPDGDETPPVAKKTIRKVKRKSPKKEVKDEILDKLAVDPKIYQRLTKEYRRLVAEMEKSSESLETDESPEKVVLADNKLVVRELPPVKPKLDNKRKSPERLEDRKKLKEECHEVKEVDSAMDVKVDDSVEGDSVLARLEKKYRRGSIKSNEDVPKVEEPPTTTTATDVESSDVPACSVIERLERKLKQKRETDLASSLGFTEPSEIIKESPALNSVALVKGQTKKQTIEEKPIDSMKEPETGVKVTQKTAVKDREPEKLPEVDCFETLVASSNNAINDILSDIKLTGTQTEKALKEFQRSFDDLANDDVKETQVETHVEIQAVDSLLSLPKENDFDFSYEPINIQVEAAQPEVLKIISSHNKTQPLVSNDKPEEIKPEKNRKQKCKSFHMDLAEIDLGISERPLNLDNLFQRRSSIEVVPDSPKSLNSNDDTKIISAKDSAYSGSRKSSIGNVIEETKTAKTDKEVEVSASYIDVLKDISCGLVGFNDADIMLEPPVPKEKAEQHYAKALQDISSNLVGLDLDGVASSKNYSQIIPPFVHEAVPIRKASNFSQAFRPDFDDSLGTSEAPESTVRIKRGLPTSKSFDYDTISGRTSKNSTEYYDHYYPTAINGRRPDKYEPTQRKEHIDGVDYTKTRHRAIDDLMVKTPKTRMYEADDVLLKRQSDYRRQSSEPSDASVLLERSHMLHRRKESFMRDQMNESNNPYIREMMKQDVDNPINISDIKFIRNHPSAPLPSTTSHLLSTYQRPATYVPSMPTRPPRTYAKSSVLSPVTTSSYSRSTAPVSSYKSSAPSSSSIGYLSPSSSTAAHILTKSHTLSPHSSLSNSYSSGKKPTTSLLDPHATSSSRLTSRSRPSDYNYKKSSGSSRDACVIS